MAWLHKPIAVLLFGGALCALLVITGRATPYSGNVNGLHQTVVVSSLQAPLPTDRNAVWCATLDLAWQQARSLGLGTKPGQSPVADLLDKSLVTTADLDPSTSVVAAGNAHDPGLRGSMGSSPLAGISTLSSLPPDAQVAFASLSVSIPFKLPYFEDDKPLDFKTADGPVVPVQAWGIRPKDLSNYLALRRQVGVLFWDGPQDPYYPSDQDAPRKPVTFAIDPCVNSAPYQLVLAIIPPQTTLAQDIEYVQQKTSAYRLQDDPEGKKFGLNSALLVPTQRWQLFRDWPELCRPQVQSGLDLVRQVIDFRLDRSGAAVESRTDDMAMGMDHDFIFDRPHLVYVEKRGSTHPVFAMWVATAELLQQP